MVAENAEFSFEEWTRLGAILVRRGSITERQLLRARAAQNDKFIGEVVVEMGFCTPQEIHEALDEQRRHRAPYESPSNDAAARLEAAFARVDAETERLSSKRPNGAADPIKIDL